MRLKEFYATEPARAASGEADYGVWWMEGWQQWPRYRVSYVRRTGEVYAINLVTTEVEILAVVPPDGGQNYYGTLDRLLRGWADVCGEVGGLDWLRNRLQEHRP